MKTEVERILAAEAAAKEKIAEAEKRAKEISDQTKALKARIVEEAREQAIAQAQAQLRDTTQEAAAERVRIIDEAKARAASAGKQALAEQDSIVAGAIAQIAGLA